MTNHSISDQTAALKDRAVPPALRELLKGRAALGEKFAGFQNAFHEEGAVDSGLLELCRARVDALHGAPVADLLDQHTAELVASGQFATFSAEEQLALSLAEQIAIDAHGVSDKQMSELNAALGEAATVSLLTAVSMHDAALRLQRVLEPLIDKSQTDPENP